MFADATFIGGGEPALGRDAVEKTFRDTLITYDDGTPRTQHVTTNTIIDVDENAATSRAYFTVLQALPGGSLRVIACGRYRDRFARRDGEWRFAERRARVTLTGDLSQHLR